MEVKQSREEMTGATRYSGCWDGNGTPAELGIANWMKLGLGKPIDGVVAERLATEVVVASQNAGRSWVTVGVGDGAGL